MIVAAEVRALPVLPDMAASIPYWEKLFTKGIPGFAVDNVLGLAPTDIEPAVAELDRIGVELFAGGGHKIRSDTPLTDRQIEQDLRAVQDDELAALGSDLFGDLYLHADGDVNEQLDATLHRTTDGRGQATLVAVKPHGLDLSLLRRIENTRLVRRDYVDDDVLQPVLHRVELLPNRLVVFRRGGRPLVAHLFETTQAPRHSEVSWVGRPGLERFTGHMTSNTQC